MSGMNDSLDKHPLSRFRKITPTRPLYNDYQSAFVNITPHRWRSQLPKMDAMEDIDFDDVRRGDFSSTCPPRIDLGQGSRNNRQPSIRKKAVDVLTRAFSNRQASATAQSHRAAGIHDDENTQEHAQEYVQEYDTEYDDHYDGEYDGDYDEDDDEDNSEDNDMEETGIRSIFPDLDRLRTIQTNLRRSDPFDLEAAYSNVLSGEISAPSPMPQLPTMNEIISQFRKDSESSDEEAPAGIKEPLPSRAAIQDTQQCTGKAPDGSLPSLPRPLRHRNYFAPGAATTSELASASYGETRNLLAMGQQSSQKRMSDMSRTNRLSMEDVLNLQSPLKRLTLYGRQVFRAGGEMDLSVGDVRQQPQINEREVSHALHQQVSNSGPSHSTGTGNHEGRVWFTQTSTSDSNELLNYLSGHREDAGEVPQMTEGFYDQQHIDATWVDAQDTNAVRVPIIRPNSTYVSSQIETESQHEDQEIQAFENEWETVADTVSMGNNNPYVNHNYRQAGSSVANTSDAGQDLDYAPQQAAGLSSHEVMIQHPAINTYPHRYANRQIPGSERDMRIPQYMGHRVGTNNSLRTNPFSSPPPERLSAGSQVARGPIMDFGRDPLTNSSATNGLTMSAEAATDSSASNGLTSRNFITSSRILTGYDPGSDEGMWMEQSQMEQSQRLSIPPPLPMRSPLRSDHYLGSQTSSSVNSWDYVRDAANDGDDETIPMMPLAPPRPAYFGGNVRRNQQNRQPELRRPPGAFYEHIRAAQSSQRSPKRHSSRLYERLPGSGSISTIKSTRPESNFHPKTQKPWPRIRSMPGPDGHHPSRSNNKLLATNQYINMGEFQFKDPTWEAQYTPQQMQRIRANHRRREQQQRSINANIPVSPPQLYPARRTQFISDPAVRSQQSKLSYIALICCVGLPGIGWLLFWYGTLDKFICSITDGEIERFGKKQKKIALYLACLTGLITISVLVYLIFAVVNHLLS